MPNIEELLNQISLEIIRDRTVQLFISKIHVDSACGQMKLSEETSRPCVFAIIGENLEETTDSKKRFTDSPIYLPYSERKLTEHSEILHTGKVRRHNCSNTGK